MTPIKVANFPLLEIASFVDSTTVVIIGHKIEDIKLDDKLYVLGIGFSIVPKTDMPLISPKAELEVTLAPGPYVLAKSELQQVKLRPAIESLMPGLGLTTETTALRRPALSDKKDSFLGNPGSEPVKIGDTVIRKDDLTSFATYWMNKDK
jgi:hypothetical protein